MQGDRARFPGGYYLQQERQGRSTTKGDYRSARRAGGRHYRYSFGDIRDIGRDGDYRPYGQQQGHIRPRRAAGGEMAGRQKTRLVFNGQRSWNLLIPNPNWGNVDG